jgi:hypothetical protein
VAQWRRLRSGEIRRHSTTGLRYATNWQSGLKGGRIQYLTKGGPTREWSRRAAEFCRRAAHSQRWADRNTPNKARTDAQD